MSKRKKGKHSSTESPGKQIFKLLTIIWFLPMLIIIAFYAVKYRSSSKALVNDNISVLEEQTEEEVKNEEIVDEEMPDKIGNYDVLGKISIESIGVEQYILDKTTDESLSLAVTKFYGPDINEPGNFVITGHNYKDIFAYVLNLKKGDTFYIVDKQNSRKVTYEVYNTYIVNPKELDCLNQETKGKREVTLITCEPGAVTRFIVKAKEI